MSQLDKGELELWVHALRTWLSSFRNDSRHVWQARIDAESEAATAESLGLIRNSDGSIPFRHSDGSIVASTRECELISHSAE